MGEPDDPTRRALRRIAASLEGRAEAIAAEEIRSRRAPIGREDRRRVLLVAAAVLLAAVGAAAWSVAGDGEEQTTVVGPGPEATLGSTSTSSPGPDDQGGEEHLYEWYDWDALPAEGVAVQALDGTLALYDLAGAPLGRGPASPDLRGPQLVVQIGQVQSESPGMAEVPPGCASAAVAGGLRVSRCGDPDTPRLLQVVDSAGRSTTVADGAPRGQEGGQAALGFWRSALPSPDGRWILAEWSAECGTPHAVVIEAATGAVHDVAEPVEGLVPSSHALGWSSDGRAVVDLDQSECGATSPEVGVHLFDPTTGSREPILPGLHPVSQAFHWTKRAYGNDAEWLVAGALRALGLDGCCGEPSHGGPGVTSGAVFEGHEIGISGFPSDVPMTPPLVGRPERVPLLHGEASMARIDGEGPYPGSTLVSFTCGTFTWRLSWWSDGAAEVDSMLRLGETIVPYLGCALGEPPDA